MEKSALTAIHYWLAVKLIPRLSINNKLTLVDKFGVEGLFEQLNEKALAEAKIKLTAKQLSAIKTPNWQKITDIIANSQACDSNIITYDAPEYPSQLKAIYDPPLLIFAKGNISLLKQSQIAIVGSRNATIAGREIAQSFSENLASKLVVTSGLAIGIDAFAHQGALKAKGFTIAVVATGLDITYPHRHKKLQQSILANAGLVISEFIPGVTPKPGLFPKRNRIISGLSVGVLVVEASMKSGSLVTARCALEQGRDVFSVPSSIYNEQAKGCHWLIKQGAKLVEDVDDIIEELPKTGLLSTKAAIMAKKSPIKQKSDKEHLCNNAILASVGYEITPVDKVVSRTKLPIEVVLTQLTVLELKGLVCSVPGGYLKL